MKKTTEQFVKEAQKAHEGKYDYSLTIYTGKTNRIKFICPKHGVVEQMPYRHVLKGCPFCAGRGVGKHTKATFIEKAVKVHGSLYDYSKVEFESIHDKVVIICPIHGEFLQKAANHINLANGCPQCKGGVSTTTQDFIRKANQKHKNKFDYAATQYTKSHEKVKITCPKHGEFEQLAYMHLQTTHGCPDCANAQTTSCGEKEIQSFLLSVDPSLNIRKTKIDKLEIDLFLPDYQVGIEYHGLYWHNELYVGRSRHVKKADMAFKNKIKLIQIFENEWQEKQEIVKSRILSAIGKNQKIMARKTKVVPLDVGQKANFLNQNHIQGSDKSSTVLLGLEYENELVACMTFGASRFGSKYAWELIRYANKIGVNVIGGAGKLLKHFKQNHKGSIVSYADRRWSNGDLYQKLGFKLDCVTTPGYFYYNIKTKEILQRMKCQKHKLINLPGYNPALSEKEIMLRNNFIRVWDAGHLRFVLDE